MKTLTKLIALAVLFAAPSMLMAQSQPTRTTLSSALGAANPPSGSGPNNLVSVASVTGITASTASLQSYCLIDSELMAVRSISGTTLTVIRNKQGFGSAHLSGAAVYCGFSGTFDPKSGNVSTVVGSPTVGASVTGATFVASAPVGTCTRSNQAILPVFYVTALPTGYGQSYGYAFDCLGGRWVPGTLEGYPDAQSLVLACTPNPIGNVAYASIGTNTADIAGQEWASSIYIPQSAFVTKVSILSGGTSTTDNIYMILRDSTGNAIANSAVAGVTLSGANTFQSQSLTAGRLLVGPARYFLSVVGNGTAAGAIETISASTYNNVLTKTFSGAFGTITSTAAVPTTFTAGAGPIGCIVY